MCLVDGSWGEWGEWSTCTKTCKQGKQSRTRECNSPAPQYGGKNCDGEAKETQICNKMVPCPGKMGIAPVCLFCCVVEIIYCKTINNLFIYLFIYLLQFMALK